MQCCASDRLNGDQAWRELLQLHDSKSGYTQEWTNHRNAKSSRFANSVGEPGFNLNSPLPFQGKNLRIQEKNGVCKTFVLDAAFCCDGGPGPEIHIKIFVVRIWASVD